MSRLLYDNRRLLTLTVLLIVVAGLSSFYVLPRMEDPVLTQRAAIVNTLLPGATPDRVEALLLEPLEEELRTVPEIKEFRSTARAGVASIVIELRDDVYEAAEVWSRVRDKLDDAQPLLPAEASDPDFELLEVTAYASILALRWDAPGEANYAVLRRLAEELEQRLLAVPGTREVDTFGDPAEEVLIEIDAARLATLGLSADEVASQLAASDAKVAAGQLRTAEGSFAIEVDSELDTVRRIASTPIRYGAGESGRVVTLGSVAEVRKGIADPPSRLSLVDGKPAISVAALVRGDQRIDTWARRAEGVVERFEADLPPAIGLKRVFEQSPYVEQRLATLLLNLMVGAGAVMGVIWLMMGWRSALVVGSALPLASLMVLAGMRWLGVPIHQMSVTGLIIALGLLIDNAIVIVDEVSERLREGLGPGEAVSGSVRHLAAPLFGSTLTTCLSFAPIALMPGPAGEFVGAIALSVMMAVAASFFLAMTVTPAIAAIVSPSDAASSRRGWWSNGLRSDSLTAWYRSAVGHLVRRPLLGVVLAIAPPVAGFVLAGGLTEQFFPPAERDQFQIQADLPAGSSIEATRRVALAAREALLKNPRVTGVDWYLGESAPSFYYNMIANRAAVPHYAQAIVQIDSKEDYFGLIRELQQELDTAFPGVRFLARQLEQGPPFEAPIEARLYGPDLDRLRELGLEVRRVLAETPGVVHTQSDLSETLPKLKLDVNEAAARLAGLDNRMIARQLDATLEGALGGSVLEATENLPIRVRVSGADRGELGRVAGVDLLGRSAETNAVARTPLAAVAGLRLTPERSAVPHFNGERMNEVKGYLTAGGLTADVQGRFEARLAESGFTLPPGYRLEYAGEGSKRNDAIGNLLSNVVVLLVLMAATLVLSFGSFRMAGLIGTVAGLSIGLAVGALAIAGYPFGFTAIIGAMGLVGVAINDTIVVLAAIRDDQRARSGEADAVRDVVVRSSRHVFATTLTTIAGFLPLLLGGGGFWPPMAVTIAGGVGGATLLALVFAPCAYTLLMCGSAAVADAREAERKPRTPLQEPSPRTPVVLSGSVSYQA